MFKRNQEGFSSIELAIVVVVVVAIGFAGYVVEHNSYKNNLAKNNLTQSSTGNVAASNQTLPVSTNANTASSITQNVNNLVLNEVNSITSLTNANSQSLNSNITTSNQQSTNVSGAYNASNL